MAGRTPALERRGAYIDVSDSAEWHSGVLLAGIGPGYSAR